MSATLVERLMRHDVVLLRRVAADDDGDPTFTEVEQPTRCELQPSGSSEAHEGSVLVTGWRVFLPADAPATGWDAIRLADGTVLELEGDAGLFINPRTGEPSHLEANVRRSR